LSAKLLKNSQTKFYPGFPHGIPTTNAEQINGDLLAFIKKWRASCGEATTSSPQQLSSPFFVFSG
jgi:hypothetical protein